MIYNSFLSNTVMSMNFSKKKKKSKFRFFKIDKRAVFDILKSAKIEFM